MTIPESRLYGSPQGLYDFQSEGVATCYLRPANLAIWDCGIGKAAPLSEPVLTPNGWVTMGDLQVGQRVVGRDGCPTEILGIHPQTDREVYKVVFSDGSWTRCNKDHLWTVSWWGSSRKTGKQVRVRRTETLTLQTLIERGVKNRATRGHSGGRRFSIPMCNPVQYPEQSFPIDPYALGVILGDGWIGPLGQVHLGLNDKEVFDTLGEPKMIRPGYWRLVTTQWASALNDLELAGTHSWDKKVPALFLQGSEEQRRALLAGLLDTDGSPIASGGAEFTSVSHDLALGVKELAQSLGGTATISAPRQTHYSHNGEVRIGRPSWRVNVKINQQPFRLTRKMLRWIEPTKYPPARFIDSVTQVEDEDQVCISVATPDGLYLTRNFLVTHNSHMAMALAALLFEDGLIDLCLLVAEKNKLEKDEWPKDLTTYTKLDWKKYHGTNRAKLRDDLPQVLLSTYETIRLDVARIEKVQRGRRTVKTLVPNVLTETIISKCKSVLVVYDEMTKLGNRSNLHKSHDLMLKTLRKAGVEVRVLGLTATPIERSPENIYNLGRLLVPGQIPTVDRFSRNYVLTRDGFGNAVKFKNLSVETQADRDVIPLAEVLRPVILRKRKTDDDVIDQFPRTVEEPPMFVTLSDNHYDFLDSVRATFETGDDVADRPLFTLMRQLAGHPASVVHSQGQYAQAITEAVGEASLRVIGCAKLDRLVEYLVPLIRGQGAQATVFTFFGKSVLPFIQEALEDVGFRVAINHSGLADRFRSDEKARFKAGHADVFLTSDAGARGINLPEATYAIEYESALTRANQVQRLNRIHRIDSTHPSVTFGTLVARDTVEEGIIQGVLRRNEWSDQLLEDGDPGENFVTASQRRRVLAIARKRTS